MFCIKIRYSVCTAPKYYFNDKELLLYWCQIMNRHIIVVYFSLKEESCSPAMVLIWSSTHIRLHIWLMLKLRSDRWTQYVWRGLFFQYAHYYTKEKRQMEANHWINENSLFIPSSKNWFNDTTGNLSLKSNSSLITKIINWLLYH